VPFSPLFTDYAIFRDRYTSTLLTAVGHHSDSEEDPRKINNQDHLYQKLGLKVNPMKYFTVTGSIHYELNLNVDNGMNAHAYQTESIHSQSQHLNR